jgi:TrmH family RNA methyltransferase
VQQDEVCLALESRSNPRFKALKQLTHDNDGAREQKRVWLEGDHLVRAAVGRGFAIAAIVATQEGLRQWAHLGLVRPSECTVLSQTLWKDASQLASVWQFAAIVELPRPVAVDVLCPTVVLDRIQDPGNVGSILRSASAFGYRQVLALKGTASLWGPKVLRAAMGAHFGLRVHESLRIEDLALLRQFRCVTSSHLGQSLSAIKGAAGSQPLVWIFGNEGQGVVPALMDSADLHLRIDQPGGEESLNVAAAAAICLHASAVG